MAMESKAKAQVGGILGKGATGSWELYGNYLPLYHDPNTGEAGFSLRGPLNSVASIPSGMAEFLKRLYSGATFPGDVLGGRAAPADTRRLFDFLTIPMMGMDIGSPFMGAPVKGGILGSYVSTMAPEDYASMARSLSDLAGVTKPDQPKKKKSGKTILEA